MVMKPVLVVDDKFAQAKLISYMLQRHNIPAVIASSGQESVRMALELSPCLILMDLMMPQETLTGFQATATIKKSCGSIPVVALSASSDEEAAYDAGCDGFLRKPLSITELIACVEHFVGGQVY